MNEMLTKTVHDLILIGIQIGLVWALVLLRRWKLRAVEYYNARTSLKQREWLKLVGEEAFHYAERVFAEHQGSAKLHQASRYVRERAEEQGVVLTNTEIRAAIERAWTEATQTPATQTPA